MLCLVLEIPRPNAQLPIPWSQAPSAILKAPLPAVLPNCGAPRHDSLVALVHSLFDMLHQVVNGLERLQLLYVHFDVEPTLYAHDSLHSVQGIEMEIGQWHIDGDVLFALLGYPGENLLQFIEYLQVSLLVSEQLGSALVCVALINPLAPTPPETDVPSWG